MNKPAKTFRRLIEQVDLNQTTAAKFFRVADRTSRNWAATGAPYGIEIALTLMVEHGLTADDVELIMRKR